MFPNIYIEYFSKDEIVKVIHFPERLEPAVNWTLNKFACNWWGMKVTKKGDLSSYLGKLVEILENKFRVKSGDKVFLYSGSRDWDFSVGHDSDLSSVEEHFRILKPVISAIEFLDATPVLLSCFCECRDYEKRRLVKMFNITLGYQNP